MPEFVTKVLGTVFGKLALAIYLLFYFAELTRVVAGMGATTQQLLLPNTPIPVTVLMMLGVAMVLARNGLNPILRYVEFTTPWLALIFFLIILSAIPQADFGRLLPILSRGMGGVFRAAIGLVARASGVEILLFIFPYLENKNKVVGPAAAVMAVRTVYLMFLSAVTISVLGLKETLHQVWPVVGVVKSLEFSGFGIERLDSFFDAVWIMSTFAVVAVRLFFCTYLFTTLIGAKTHKFAVRTVVALAFLVGTIPINLPLFESFVGYLTFFSGAMLIGFTFLLWFLATITRKGRKAKCADS